MQEQPAQEFRRRQLLSFRDACGGVVFRANRQDGERGYMLQQLQRRGPVHADALRDHDRAAPGALGHFLDRAVFHRRRGDDSVGVHRVTVAVGEYPTNQRGNVRNC